jgi:trk system potassium uptake protein TrkA
MHLIIVGCGRVGSELAHTVAEKGHTVVILDRDPENFKRLGPDFQGRTIQGDVRDRDVLLRAGIENANGFAAVTPNDDLNLISARTARDLFNVPNIVARVYDPNHARAFEIVGLQTVISSSWSAHRIEQLLTHPGLIELASLGNGEVFLMEAQVPEHMTGKRINDLSQECTCQPTALVRGGQANIISPDTALEAGDLLIIAVSSSNLSQLEEALRMEEA